MFRPWVPESIALAFTEKGAAAFARFAYSPESGSLMGAYNGLPFRTLTSKITSFNALAIVGTFVLAGSTGALYVLTLSKFGRVTALILVTLPAWLPAVLHLGFTFLINATVFQPRVGASIYNHQMELLAGYSSVIAAVAVIGVFTSVRRLFAPRSTDGQ